MCLLFDKLSFEISLLRLLFALLYFGFKIVIACLIFCLCISVHWALAQSYSFVFLMRQVIKGATGKRDERKVMLP